MHTSSDNIRVAGDKELPSSYVFRTFAGLWRGSNVAVKTMVLPAKMSGAEKRERMAVMEAAISSAM